MSADNFPFSDFNFELSPWLRPAVEALDTSRGLEPDEEDRREARVGKRWLKPSPELDIAALAALVRLCAALPKDEDGLVDRIHDPYAISIIETGGEDWLAPVEHALDDGLLPAMRKGYSHLPRPSVIAGRDDRSKRSRRDRGFAQQAQELLAEKKPRIFVVESACKLPEIIRSAAGLRIRLDPIDGAAVRLMHQMLHGPKDISLAVADRASEWSADVARLSPVELSAALRHPDPQKAASSVKDLVAASKSIRRPEALGEVKGLGAAGEILEQLAQDMIAWQAGELCWSEIQHGVLLHGQPGTGKTFCAGKIAERIGAHFLPTSYADWQRHGHLNDFLAAMNASFTEARSKAPSVLFIDEIDSFGDRKAATGDNTEYVRNAIDALLEQLDGAAGSEGVLVVGACNHPEHLDAAIVRSGRFDIKIEVPLPGRAALEEILESHLGSDGGSLDLSDVAARLVGCSGADAAALVRSARSIARREGRRLQQDDLASAIHALAPESSPADLERSALHEAGHAVVGFSLGRGIPQSAAIGSKGGAVTFSTAGQLPTLDGLTAELSILLAGRAAEEVLLGAPSAGAGGPAKSDLGAATLLATSLEVTYGLGESGLVWRPVCEDNIPLLLADSKLVARVETRLADALDAARAIVREHRGLVESCAAQLLEHRQLGQSELARILAPVAEDPEGPAVARSSEPNQVPAPRSF